MAFLQVHNNENEIILNTPNRKEILKQGPPKNSKCNILGRGAYGTVFKATFQAKQVAVKIIKNLKDINMQSMQNEANILGWNHRNIVKILKIESTPNFGIVIMERFSGHSLQMVLDTVELPLEHMVFISLDILSALSYCHSRQLLHLDVKPQNVLVSFGKVTFKLGSQNALIARRRNYVCKLCDFGSSMNINTHQTPEFKGSAKGTVRYMSPEALCEEPLTTASDIYSLGITMWQLQYRQLPYYWLECNEIVAYQVVKNNLRPDSDAALSKELCAVDSFKTHQNCFCQKLSSEMSLEYLKNLLKCSEKYNEQKHYSEEISVNAKRRPFQHLNANVNVVRDLNCDLGLKTVASSTVEERFSIPAYTQQEEFNLSSIFRHSNCLRNVLKEASFEALFKSCWHSDSSLRPNLSECGRLLKQLLYN